MSASPRAGSLPLVGGALALDFCNTTTGRGTDKFVEHLFDYEDLLRWSAHAAIVSRAEAARLAATPSAAAAFAHAMATRALLNRIFDRLATGRRAETSALAALAQHHAESWREAALVAAEGGFRWRIDATRRPDALLAPIVQSAVEVLTRADLARLRQCPGIGCGWVFLDETKNASRVWCEMAVCGTRAKLRHRAEARRALAGEGAKSRKG
jgi:predicted RNA-binding Zn ribbon-like protein